MVKMNKAFFILDEKLFIIPRIRGNDIIKSSCITLFPISSTRDKLFYIERG